MKDSMDILTIPVPNYPPCFTLIGSCKGMRTGVGVFRQRIKIWSCMWRLYSKWLKQTSI